MAVPTAMCAAFAALDRALGSLYGSLSA